MAHFVNAQMVRLLCFILLSAFCFAHHRVSAQITSDTRSAFMAPLAKESVLLDIDVEDYAVAVGERGHVLVGFDDQSFVQVPTPTRVTLSSVEVVGQNIWAAGHDATIIHSADSGQTWEVQFSAPELDKPFLDILFFDENHGIAIGAYGLFYRTENAGKTWKAERYAELLDPADQEYLKEIRQESEAFYIQELDSILPHLNRITLVENQLILVGESGLIAMSSDMGRSWERKDIDYAGSLFDVRGIQPSFMGFLAVGLRGNAFYSETGDEWLPLNTCTTSTLNSVLQVSSDSVLAVGNNGVLVSYQLPLELDQLSSGSECGAHTAIMTRQTAEKNAIVAVANFSGSVVAVTANGLSFLQTQ